MGKETIIAPTPLQTSEPRTGTPVQKMTMEKAGKLIRKTSAEHAGLLRRLAK